MVWPAIGLTAAVAFMLGLVAAGSLPGRPGTPWSARPSPAAASPAPAPAATAPRGATTALPDFSAVVASVEAGVVSVRAATRGSGPRPAARGRYPADLGEDASAAREESGSGFLIDPAGSILTNYHIIQRADRVTVTLADGRVFKASITGVDEGLDVALLQIEAQDPLPVVPIGRSEDLRVGEWVCAIGSPIGYANSVTVGVVSFLDRRVSQWSVDGVIQTDAAMSLGSSGSPLLNAAGQVIGITAAFSAVSANIGFAIPISQVMAVLPQLREWGRVSRGHVSLGLTTVTPELRSALHLEPQHGALVEDVPPDRSADRAGIQTYDVIVAVDGTQVSSDAELMHAVAGKRPGTVASFEVWRNGTMQTVPVRLEERPLPQSPGAVQPPGVRTAAGPELGPLGVAVRDLDATTVKNLPVGMAGVRVVDVDPAGPARLARVRLGQVVIELNRRPVRSAAEFETLAGALKAGDVAAVLVYEPLLKEYAILSILLDQRP
jgi:serine protease Do